MTIRSGGGFIWAQAFCCCSGSYVEPTPSSRELWGCLQLLDPVLFLEGQHPVLPRYTSVAVRRAAVAHVTVLLSAHGL